MAYNLGVIGIGHWFERLYIGMLRTNEIKLVKIASASGIEKKREQVTRLGVPIENYYKIESTIPEEFFNGIDIVHISDPNEFHAEQTMQSLKKGLITITEKTWGVNRDEFGRIAGYIRENRLEERSYLHLHYMHKLLVIELPDLLKKFVSEHGRIVSSSATFFEVESASEQAKRKWLFSLANGGLFMDWIHPFEVYQRGALATDMNLREVSLYIANPRYTDENPTGVYAIAGLDGAFFEKGAYAKIRIAKGVRVEHQKKCVRMVFGSGHYLNLNFVNSEVEYTSDIRGTWELYDSAGKLVDSGAPKGPTSSDILVNDIVCLCKGKNLGLTLQDASLIFKPQWQYQEMVKDKELIREKAYVEEFIRHGLANEV